MTRYRFKTLFLLTLGMTFVLQVGQAQQVTIRSLDEAMLLARKQNHDLQMHALDVEKSNLELKQANSHRLPTITGSVSGQRNIDLATTPLPAEIFGGEPGQTVNAQFGQEYTYNAGITIAKQLFDREASLQTKVAELNAKASKSDQEVFYEVLAEQVALYYYTGLIAQKAIETGEKDLESATHVKALTDEKFEQGLIDAIARNSASINQNAVRQNLNANKYLQAQCDSELKKLLGLNPNDELLLQEDLSSNLPEAVNFTQLYPSARVENSALLATRAGSQIKLAQSSLWPSLSLNSYYGRQQFRNDFGFSLDQDAWSNYSYLSLNLSVPIFSGLNNRRNIKRSKVDHQIALNEKSKTALHAELDDLRLISDYQLSLEDAQSSQDSYLLYKENQELTYEKYQEGLVSLEQYLRSFEEYLKAENNYLNYLSKVYSYYSQLIPRIHS